MTERPETVVVLRVDVVVVREPTVPRPVVVRLVVVRFVVVRVWLVRPPALGVPVRLGVVLDVVGRDGAVRDPVVRLEVGRTGPVGFGLGAGRPRVELVSGLLVRLELDDVRLLDVRLELGFDRFELDVDRFELDVDRFELDDLLELERLELGRLELERLELDERLEPRPFRKRTSGPIASEPESRR